MVNIYDDIYIFAEQYIRTNSIYSPQILADSPQESKVFPLVVITQTEDILEDENLDKTNQESIVIFEIEIFAKDTDTTARQIIIQELKELVDTVFNAHYGFERASCRPIPNADRNISRFYMRYTALVDENKKIRR